MANWLDPANLFPTEENSCWSTKPCSANKSPKQNSTEPRTPLVPWPVGMAWQGPTAPRAGAAPSTAAAAQLSTSTASVSQLVPQSLGLEAVVHQDPIETSPRHKAYGRVGYVRSETGEEASFVQGL